MPRTFDGVDDFVTLSLGALGFAFGPGTVAAIIKRSADSSIDELLYAGVSSTARWALTLGSANNIVLRTNNTSAASGAGIDSCLAADGWLLVAATKATGTVAPRFHRYEYATGVWQHANSATSIADSSVPITNAFIGATHAGANPFAGDGDVKGAWDVVLTDAQIEAMAYSLPAWFQVQPKGLWLLDQAITGQLINDRSGGGANESAITGTAVGTSSLPVFSYGAPIEMAQFNSAVTTPLTAAPMRV